MSRPAPFLFLAALALSFAASASRSQEMPASPLGRPWTGKWIWTAGEKAPRNSYTYFRKALPLEEAPRPQRPVRVHLTADSRYQLWVNGEFVGRGPVRSDRRWLYYDTWDLTPHLRKGDNAIAVLVHHYGESTFQYMQGRGGLLADVTGSAGVVLTSTNASWKALRSPAWGSVHPAGVAGQPRMSIQQGYSETFDARQEPVGWNAAGFDDTPWPAATEIGEAGMEPWPGLVPRDLPAMLEEPRAAKKVLEVVEVEEAGGAQYVDLLSRFDPREWAAAYLATTLVSPDRREVELKFGSDDALKVWLNGKPIVGRLIDRAAAADQETVKVTLEPGPNPLLAKVVQGHSKWEFYFRMAGRTEGIHQEAPGQPAANPWLLAGPFPFPRDDSLKTGYDQAFAPEAGLGRPADPAAVFKNSLGREVGWKGVTPAAARYEHVSQMMAARPRHPLKDSEVRDVARISGRTGSAYVRTAPGRGVSFLIDFGTETTGFPHFRVRGARGGEVLDMGYGEVLHAPDGSFVPQSADTLGRLNPDRDGVHYADRYICRAGDQTFRTFDKRGFRYLQFDVFNAPDGIEIEGVGLLFSTYPVEYRGAFQCSDERLNRIWEIGRWTCQLNMEDGYTDCPWRERGQWWGDARVEALINYYCFGDTKLIRKCLRQQGQSLNDEGITWGVYPTDWDGGRLPSFTLIWVSTLWETYLYTGDKEIVRELFPKVRTTLDKFFGPRVGPRGLLKDVPYWVFIDWAPVETEGEGGSLNAYYFDALQKTAEMARLLDDAPAAAEYMRRAEAVRQAMNTHLWDEAAGAYRDSLRKDGSLSPKFSQQTNSLCVLLDLAPRAKHARILDFIYSPEVKEQLKDRLVEAGSPYFSYYQLAALFHAGRHEQAMAYIREKWGRMLDWGATTWWEMWTPGASFCHGWSGGPTFNLGAEVLGVQPLKPGFAEVAIQPHWVGLKHASGVVPTAKGEVRVAWQRDPASGAAAIRVETPEGVPAEITLPGRSEALVNKKARLPKDVTRLEAPSGFQRFRLEEGGSVLLEFLPGR